MIRLKSPNKLIWAYRNLYAVKKLIKRYRTNPTKRGFIKGWCPLCIVNDGCWVKSHNRYILESDCDLCPWLVFEREGCGGYINKYEPLYADRLTRLARWKEKLLQIIEECWEEV